MGVWGRGKVVYGSVRRYGGVRWCMGWYKHVAGMYLKAMGGLNRRYRDCGSLF